MAASFLTAARMGQSRTTLHGKLMSVVLAERGSDTAGSLVSALASEAEVVATLGGRQLVGRSPRQAW